RGRGIGSVRANRDHPASCGRQSRVMATLEGLDVSRWQGTTPNLAGKAFLFARATYGAIRDQMYSTHIANARKAGLLVGAYHFGVGDVPVPSQVSAFLGAAGTVDFYVLDLESNGGRPSMTLGQASLFIALVRAKNHKNGLYHSDSGFPLTLGQSYNWVAKWSVNPPTHPWTFWQYRGSPLDLDRFNGDEAKLQALAGNAGPVRLRVVITGPTKRYSKVGGTVVGSVSRPSYAAGRVMH